jgi:hypothetical protein
MNNKIMNIENLDETLVDFINEYLPNLNWDGKDSSADVDLLLDENSTIEDDLMMTIANAMIATKDKEFTLTIRPSENKLILYYID